MTEEQRLKRNANSRRFYEKNKEEQREYHKIKNREWRKNNPDRYNELQRGYKLKKKLSNTK